MSSFYDATVGRENSSCRVEDRARDGTPAGVHVIARNTVEIIKPEAIPS